MKATYCDGGETPMALMSMIIGEQASGKGVCRRIESCWAKKMDQDDKTPRETVLKMIRRWTKRGLCKKMEGNTEMWQKLPISA